MIKVYSREGQEVIFETKDIENDLRTAGLSERIAQEVAERVKVRVQDGWTTDQIKQETDVELRRLQEDIDRAHNAYKSNTPMGAYNVGEARSGRDIEYSSTTQPRSETRVECRNVE